MNCYIGTSGYSYKEWKGSFYPADLPDKGMLHYYGGHLRTVEINSTFHRMPTTKLLEHWAEEVPPGFRFVLKAPQTITHVLRLRDADQPLSYLMETVGILGERLGAVLFQLPPWLRKDLPLLGDFLAQIPPSRRVAFEFRHESWFDDQLYGLLQQHRAALCIAEAEGKLQVPCLATASWGYLRLRRPDYSDAELQAWVERVRQQQWEEFFLFFKHEDEGNAPLLARRFLELLSADL